MHSQAGVTLGAPPVALACCVGLGHLLSLTGVVVGLGGLWLSRP